MAEVSIIVAVAKNGVIGASGDMPWKLSTDLKRFKQLTMGKVMIMGRKTFDSIGKALPGRATVVVTRNPEWQAEGVVPVSSLEAAMELSEEIAKGAEMDEICIVGGGQIYKQAMDVADILHVTKVLASPSGDTMFPPIDGTKFELVSQESVPAGEKDDVDTEYCVYRRRDTMPITSQ